jgi:hypothetical protein
MKLVSDLSIQSNINSNKIKANMPTLLDFLNVKENDIITGKIVEVNNKGIILDVNGKLINAKVEHDNLKDQIKVGEVLDFKILTLTNEKIELSHFNSEEIKKDDSLIKAANELVSKLGLEINEENKKIAQVILKNSIIPSKEIFEKISNQLKSLKLIQKEIQIFENNKPQEHITKEDNKSSTLTKSQEVAKQDIGESKFVLKSSTIDELSVKNDKMPQNLLSKDISILAKEIISKALTFKNISENDLKIMQKNIENPIEKLALLNKVKINTSFEALSLLNEFEMNKIDIVKISSSILNKPQINESKELISILKSIIQENVAINNIEDMINNLKDNSINIKKLEIESKKDGIIDNNLNNFSKIISHDKEITFFSFPFYNKEKEFSVNIGIKNNSKNNSDKQETKIFIALETEYIGNVKTYIVVTKSSIDLNFKVESKEILTDFIESKDYLIKNLSHLGKTINVSFTQGQLQTVIDDITDFYEVKGSHFEMKV